MADHEGQPEPQVDDAPPAEAVPTEDATRRKFREALERKQQRHHASESALERDGSEKSHGVNGPTKSMPFRRKSV